MALSATLAPNRALYLAERNGSTEILVTSASTNTQSTSTSSYTSGGWNSQPKLHRAQDAFVLSIDGENGKRAAVVTSTSLTITDPSQAPSITGEVTLSPFDDAAFDQQWAAILSNTPTPPTPPSM